MALDPRTPVLVGGGQVSRRDDPIEPVDLIVQAARAAAQEAGSARLLEAVDTVAVVGLLSWRYRDPGSLVADRVHAAPRRTAYPGSGGSNPQVLLNRLAA